MELLDIDGILKDETASLNILNARIAEVRRMRREEMEELGWKPIHFPPYLIVLDNGIKFIPARDTEHNKPGQMIFTLPTIPGH